MVNNWETVWRTVQLSRSFVAPGRMPMARFTRCFKFNYRQLYYIVQAAYVPTVSTYTALGNCIVQSCLDSGMSSARFRSFPEGAPKSCRAPLTFVVCFKPQSPTGHLCIESSVFLVVRKRQSREQFASSGVHPCFTNLPALCTLDIKMFDFRSQYRYRYRTYLVAPGSTEYSAYWVLVTGGKSRTRGGKRGCAAMRGLQLRCHMIVHETRTLYPMRDEEGTLRVSFLTHGLHTRHLALMSRKNLNCHKTCFQ